jgi:hypothetical protein
VISPELGQQLERLLPALAQMLAQQQQRAKSVGEAYEESRREERRFRRGAARRSTGGEVPFEWVSESEEEFNDRGARVFTWKG